MTAHDPYRPSARFLELTRPVVFSYRHDDGEVRRHVVYPRKTFYGSMDGFRYGPRWFLQGWDAGSEAVAYFAMTDIVSGFEDP